MILKNKININSAVLTPFLFAVFLFLAFNIAVYSIILNLYKDYDRLYKQSIPEIASIMSGIDDFQTAYSHIYRILSEDSNPISLSGIRQIHEKITVIYDDFEKYKDHSIYQKEINSALFQFIEFQSILHDVTSYLEKQNEIVQKRTNYLKILRYISSRMNQLEATSTRETKFVFLLNETLIHLALLNTEVPISYGSKIYEKTKENFQKIKELQNKLDISSSQSFSFIQKTSREIKTLANKEQGIFDLFLEFEEVRNKRMSILIHIDVLYNESLELASTLFCKVDKANSEHSNSFEKHIEYLFYFVAFSFLLVFAAFYFIYKFLTKYIVSPLTNLNKFIKQRANHTECVLCSEGALEVQEITDAIFYFMDQIEDREHKLLESHENLESQVKERTKEISQLSEKIIRLQEDERFKLAAELHDDIGSSMGTIKFSIERASQLLKQSDMGEAKSTLDESIHVVKSIARQLRRIQTDLRPPHLDIGLLKTLEWYVKDYRIANPKIEIQADFFFDELMLSSSLHIVTFRIIQESMNNISKHSDATKVNIQILHEDDFRIIIEDNGKGFCLDELEKNKQKKTYGIRNIHERVAISGGQLQIKSGKGQGFRIMASWKLNN